MPNSALLEDLEKQFAANPRRVFARLANEYRKSGELDRAIELCRAHIPQQPGYISGHIVLGQALFERGLHSEARDTLETALALDPENLIALSCLGSIAVEAKDIQGARAWYSRLLDVDPQNEEAANYLGALPSEQRSEEPAAPDVISWSDIHPENLADHDSLQEQPATEPAAIPEELDSVGWGAMDPDVLMESVVTDDVHQDKSVEADVAAEPATMNASESPGAHDGTKEEPHVENEPQPDLGIEQRPDVIADEGHGGSVNPPMFVTETMAELYLRQGFLQEALDIYVRLAEEDPANLVIRERVAEIERQIESSVASGQEDIADIGALAPGAPEPTDSGSMRTIRGLFSAIALRRAPSGYHSQHEATSSEASAPPKTAMLVASHDGQQIPLAGLLPPGGDDAAAFAFATAFSSEASRNEPKLPGMPSRAASEELSLDSVFGAGSNVSFDEFFSTGRGTSAGGQEAGNAEVTDGTNGAERPDADGELFHSWLEGLKK